MVVGSYAVHGRTAFQTSIDPQPAHLTAVRVPAGHKIRLIQICGVLQDLLFFMSLCSLYVVVATCRA